MIPESFIQDVLYRIDIVDLIDHYVPLKKAGANFMACCPFHGEKTPSFSVSPSKQFYHCFGCGEHGTAIGFLMNYSGLTFVEAIKELAGKLGMAVPDQANSSETPEERHEKRESRTSLADCMAKAANYYCAQLKASPTAIDYLKQRGLSGEIAHKFSIGYAPGGWQNLDAAFDDYAREELQHAGLVIKKEQGLYDRFRDRIMFPIINAKGETIAFGGRVLGQGEPKYLNSPETPLFEKGHEVFGLPQARVALRKKNTVIVVEGYMDVVALAQHGIENAVATLGTATTPHHVQKLFRQADRIVYCFDGDSAGRKAAWRALENSLEHLSEQKSIGFVFLPEADDPDSFVREHGQDGFEKMILQATPLSEFLLQEIASHHDVTSAEGRSGLVFEVKPLLTRLKAPLLRLQLVKRIAEISGFSQAEVERLCELKSITRPAPARLPRQAPSLYRKLLRLLMQKPEWVSHVPHGELSMDAPESRALTHLCQTILSFSEQTPTCASLLERLRGHECEALFSEAAGELMKSPFEDDEIKSEFEGAIERLLESENRRKFLQLQEKVQRFGVAGLSSDEKKNYLKVVLARSVQQVRGAKADPSVPGHSEIPL